MKENKGCRDVNFPWPEGREFSKLNKELFDRAKRIMEDNTQGPNGGEYIGWYGLSMFIDWLEANYEVKDKSRINSVNANEWVKAKINSMSPEDEKGPGIG